MSATWNDGEIKMLFSELSNDEIAKRIGRASSAVRKKRYLVTGHYVEKSAAIVGAFKERPCGNQMSDQEKLARIYNLASRMHIRLEGMK